MKKRNRYFPVLFLCICMMIAVLLCLNQQIGNNLLSYVHFRDKITGQELEPFYDEIGNRYYVFLPSHASPENLEVTFSGGGYIEFTTENEFYGKKLAGIPLEEDVSLFVSFLWYSENATFQFWQCSSIPTLYIQSQPEVLSYLHENQENKSSVTAFLYDESGALEFEGIAKMSGRGNSSWLNKAKRPYNLEMDHNVSFGSIEDVKRLCLFGEYSDESKLLNSTAFYVGKQLGIEYASGYEYVNLYVNGEFIGLYGIATKEEYQKYIQMDGIQAVFEGTQYGDIAVSLNNSPLRLYYGDKATVMDVVGRFEESLRARDWEACEKTIDVASFARKYILEELICNGDLTSGSQYYYIDGNEKIHYFLPWDYDLSMGYQIRLYNNKLLYEIEGNRKPNGWLHLLINMPEFRQQVSSVLEEVCTPGFVSSLQNQVKNTAEKIARSRNCDSIRWKNSIPFGSWNRGCGEETLNGMVGLYSDFFPQRVEFLKDYYSNWENYCIVRFDGIVYCNLCLPKGTRLWDYLDDANILKVKDTNMSFKGWYTETGISVEDIEAVTENMVFYPQYYTQKGG